jgi:type VI secretion system protein ImpL
MKPISPLSIITWSLLLLTGLTFAVLTAIFPQLALLFWLLAAVTWSVDAFLIIITIARSRPARKAGSVFAVNKAAMDRIARETDEAVAGYLSTVNRKGFLKRSTLYERPWFLMCGTPRSGKTSLLRGSGLDFPVRYPSDRDGALVEGENRTQWFFGNEAVWIDTPGSFMDNAGREDWQAVVASLRKVRPDCPVDGVALAVNISEVLGANDLQIKELAQRLRGRIDDLIACWGIEFPVYLLFNRSDEIPGFKEYFAEHIVAGGDEVFGATIVQRSGVAFSPRAAFAEEFNLLCKSLNDVRIDRLHREPASANKRMICRFVIHFQGFQRKLGVLAAELFKPSSYVGKPIFRGFYFTSCGERDVQGKTAATMESPSVSATIVNHPFNPHRAAVDGTSRREQPVVKKELRSIFVLPIFRGIMVSDKPLVKATRGRSRQQAIRHWSLIGVMALGALFFAAYLLHAYRRVNEFYAETALLLSSLPPENAPLMEQYSALNVMQGVMEKLQKYGTRVPLGMGIGLYRGDKLLSSLKSGYCNRLRRCMVMPAVKYLEYDIHERTGNFAELSGDDYDKLYRSLKTYLSLSEAARSHPKDIDTAFLRKTIFDAISKTLLSSSGTDRLPVKIETVLQENMGLLLTYLRRGEIPVVQEDQRLIADARARLRRLPDAASLYQGVISRLAENAPQVTLDELIGRKGQGILSSNKTISALYSQQGWDQSIKPAIKAAAEDPYKVDWVIGLSKNDVPEGVVDKVKLYDEMTAAFCDDFEKQWCGFFGAVDMEPFVDVQQSSRMVQKLVGDQSEIEKLLQAVGMATLIKDEGLAGKAGGSLLKAVAKIDPDAAKSAGTAAATAASKLPFSPGGTPFDKVNAVFDQLRSFSSSSAGGLSGYAGYKENCLTLVDKLNTIGPDGDNQALALFTGRDDDPLAAAWKFTKNTVGVMPDDLSAGLGPLLLKPLERTGTAVSQTLARALNARWQTEVLKPFAGRFSGRYPFSAQGEDASWSDVMDYFRPATGTFWGFYDRVLSSYIVKTTSGWMVRQSGGISINFNPELSAALSDADLLRTVFFKPDGTLRALDITITPSASNKNTGIIEVDGQTVDLPRGGKGARISWPFEGAQVRGATLKIQTGKDFPQQISYKGQWGLMKILGAAKVNKVNNSAFTAKWQVNVQGMYMLYFEARLQVASADHPFCDPVFQRFNCPMQLVVTGK